jgi:FHS family L-fucose permease-like MFS transporter
LLGAVADLHNSTAKAMGVPLAFFIAAWSYALCVNFVPSYRDPADRFTTAEIGLGRAGIEDVESGSARGDGVLEKDSVDTRDHVSSGPEIKEG